MPVYISTICNTIHIVLCPSVYVWQIDVKAKVMKPILSVPMKLKSRAALNENGVYVYEPLSRCSFVFYELVCMWIVLLLLLISSVFNSCNSSFNWRLCVCLCLVFPILHSKYSIAMCIAHTLCELLHNYVYFIGFFHQSRACSSIARLLRPAIAHNTI